VAAATRREEAMAAKEEAEVRVVEERVALVRLDAQKVAGEIARQPEEARALELGNADTKAKTLSRVVAAIVPLCLVAVTLILDVLGPAGRPEFSFEQL
jgi:hypothetical protein